MRASTALAVSLVLAATTSFGTTMNSATSTNVTALAPDNPFARESTLSYQLPPLDKIKDEIGRAHV